VPEACGLGEGGREGRKKGKRLVRSNVSLLEKSIKWTSSRGRREVGKEGGKEGGREGSIPPGQRRGKGCQQGRGRQARRKKRDQEQQQQQPQ